LLIVCWPLHLLKLYRPQDRGNRVGYTDTLKKQNKKHFACDHVPVRVRRMETQTCFSGNKCSLSTWAATGFSSPSAKSLHVLYNIWCVSDNDDRDDMDLFAKLVSAHFIPVRPINSIFIDVIFQNIWPRAWIRVINRCLRDYRPKGEKTQNDLPDFVRQEDSFKLDIVNVLRDQKPKRDFEKKIFAYGIRKYKLKKVTTGRCDDRTRTGTNRRHVL